MCLGVAVDGGLRAEAGTTSCTVPAALLEDCDSCAVSVDRSARPRGSVYRCNPWDCSSADCHVESLEGSTMDRTTAADIVKAASSLGGPDEVCSGGSLVVDDSEVELPAAVGTRAEAGPTSCCVPAAAELETVGSGGWLADGAGRTLSDETCPRVII